MEIVGNSDGPVAQDQSAIIDWMIKGDVSGYLYIVNRYYEAVYANCLRIGRGDRELAKDVTQEVFTEMYHRSYLLGVSDVRYYLSTCSKNALLRRLKKRARDAVAEKMFHLEQQFNDREDRIETHSLYERDLEQLHSEFQAQLSERQQQVYFLHRVKGFKLEEIARLLSMKYTTVKTHSFAGMLKIRSYVNQNYAHVLAACLGHCAFTYTFTLYDIWYC